MSEKLKVEVGKDLDPAAVERDGVERRKQLQAERERNLEKSKEVDAEASRHEAEKAIEKKEHEAGKKHEVSTERQHDVVKASGVTRKASYKKIMKDTRSQMSAPSRTFSKLIHNQAVEKTSEAIGSTVARPYPMLTGAICSFLLTLGLYLWAKYAGYPLSGFETIGAFILGWIIGIIIDYTRIMVTGKQ